MTQIKTTPTGEIILTGQHACMVCGQPGTEILPHKHSNGTVCGYLFLCKSDAPRFLNGTVTLTAPNVPELTTGRIH